MTRAATLAGYAVIAVALAAVQWRARRRGGLTLGRFVRALSTRPVTRWPLLVAWLWLGWHLFSRGSG